MTNGVGSLVAGFMPALMGGVITAVSHGSGAANTAVTAASSAAGFFAGFALLIGTQVVVFACGFLLWWRERAQRTAAVSGSQLS
ncbi:hypothetical protein D9M70_568900 [compost metagenome]